MKHTFPEEFRLGLVHEFLRNSGVVGHVVLLHVLEQTALCYLLYHLRVQRFLQELSKSGHRVLQVLEHKEAVGRREGAAQRISAGFMRRC